MQRLNFFVVAASFAFLAAACGGNKAKGSGHDDMAMPGDDLAGQDLAGQDLAGQDLAGQDLAGQDLAGLTTDLPPVGPDGPTTPVLLVTTPLNAATGASVTTPLVLRFSEAMTPASLTVTLSPVVALTAAVWSESNHVATLSPVAPLSASTLYTVQVNGTSAASVALAPSPTSFSFTTAAPPVVDTTAPTVSSTVPVNHLAETPLDTVVSITFSEAMNPTSVVVTFTPALAADASWSPDGRTLSFSNPPNLVAGIMYTVHITAGQDLAGNALAVPVNFDFTTFADTFPPTIIATSPVEAQTVNPAGPVTVTFNEPVVQATFSLTNGGADVCKAAALVWNSTNTAVTCTPSAGFAASSAITLVIDGAVTDVAGNQMGLPYTLHFNTGPSTAPDVTDPTVSSFSPTQGSFIGATNRTAIVITFSERMNLIATSAALTVTSAPLAGGASAAVPGNSGWNGAGTVISWVPISTWPRGSLITWTLSTATGDAAGNTINAAISHSFDTRYLKQTTLSLNGGNNYGQVYNHAANGVSVLYAPPSMTVGQLTLFDYTSVAPPLFIPIPIFTTVDSRAVLNFQLPADALVVVTALLNASVDSTYGDPSLVGTLMADSIYQAPDGSFSAASYGLTSLDASVSLGTPTVTGVRIVNVNNKVTADIGRAGTQGGRSQFLLHFTGSPTGGVGNTAVGVSSGSSTNLSLTYESQTP